LYGCQQSDQTLPFELDPAQGQTVTVGAGGGIVSVPPNFSIELFPGTLTGSELVSARQRLSAFPGDAGLVVPGTAFDVGPAGTALSAGAPAKVQIGVPATLLEAGDELSLTVALLQPGGSIVTDVTSYDLSNGILTAYVYELGPVAAVVASDAIVIGDIADVPPLDGGAIASVAPAPAPAPGAAPPALAMYPDGVVYTADCSPGERSCFTSGIARLWVDDTVRDRLGDDLVLLNSSVEASIEFFSFNLSSLPDSAFGYLRVDGDLRARINQVVASRDVGDEVSLLTGDANEPPESTAITISGNRMEFEFTSQGPDEAIPFDISGVGTSDLLTIELEGELEFQNTSGPPTVGTIIAHVRLRR
jgi:hypothetical protein